MQFITSLPLLSKKRAEYSILCLGNGERGRSVRTHVGPYPHTNKAIGTHPEQQVSLGQHLNN